MERKLNSIRRSDRYTLNMSVYLAIVWVCGYSNRHEGSVKNCLISSNIINYVQFTARAVYKHRKVSISFDFQYSMRPSQIP